MFDSGNGALLTEPISPGTLAGGTKTVASASTAQALVASPTPCRLVWIGARCDATGAGLNTAPVFIGDSAGQNVPITPDNITGSWFPVKDASLLFVKVGANGEGVAYRIYA